MFSSPGSRRVARRQFLTGAAATALLGMAALAGCGGGGGDPTPKPSPGTGTGGNTAIVRGRIVESTTQANVAGVIVSLGNLTATTGTDGVFAFTVPGGSDTRTLLFTLPANTYFTFGYIQGARVSLSTTGFPIAKASLTAGTTTDVGDVQVFSSSGPPPPPSSNF